MRLVDLTRVLRFNTIALAFLGVFACVAYAERLFFQAEDMIIDGKNWVTVEHFGAWYSGSPSGAKMLSGSGGKQGDAIRTAEVKTAGTYHLWVRYLDSRFRGPFKLTVTQNGTQIGEKIFDEKSLRLGNPEGLKKWGDGFGQFVWEKLPVTLQPGQVEIIMTKAMPLGVSWVARHVDCFVLTDDLNYEPKAADFVTPLYVKVKMGPGHKEPCVIHLWGRHPREPWFPPHTNIFKNRVAPGVNTGYKAAGPNEQFLRAGDESPWFNVTPFLDEIGLNALQLYAMQVYDEVLPTAEFTVYVSKTPSDDGIYKQFTRSGSGGGLLLNIDLTKRDEVSSDLENSRKSADTAANMPMVTGKRAVQFPLITGLNTGSRFFQPETIANELKMMAAIGVNGTSSYDPVYMANGITRIRPGIGFFSLTNNGCISDPKSEQIRAKVKADVQALLDKGVGKEIFSWKAMDEPGSMSLEHIAGCPKCVAAFQAYVQKQGVPLATFGKNAWADVKPVKEPKDGAVPFYYTVNFRCQALADFFKLATNAAREIDPSIRTHANFAEDLTFAGNSLKSGVDWFMIQGQGALTSGWTEDWLSYSTTYQFCGYRADYLRAACRDQLFGIYNIMRSPWDTQAKTAASIGHGAQALFYYNYGPRYAAVVDSHSERTDVMTALRKINYCVGSIEDYLVGARVPASRIGLLHTRTTDLWTLSQAHSTYGKERMGVYLLLRHLGYPVDIVTEDDAAANALERYQAIFVIGSHLRRDAANGLLQWSKNGGKLYFNAGSMTFDEFNRPLNLDETLGIARKPYIETENVGRELYEGPAWKNLETLTIAGKTLESVCGVQKIEGAKDARITATFADGSPAALSRPFGKGQLLFCGSFPGLSYLKSGVLAAKAETERLEKDKVTIITYNPPAYDNGYHSLINELLGEISYTPPVTSSHYLIEANLLEGEKGYVVTLSNWTGKPVTDLTISLTLAKKTGKAFAASGLIKSQIIRNGKQLLTLDIKEADFIVLPFI